MMLFLTMVSWLLTFTWFLRQCTSCSGLWVVWCPTISQHMTRRFRCSWTRYFVLVTLCHKLEVKLIIAVRLPTVAVDGWINNLSQCRCRCHYLFCVERARLSSVSLSCENCLMVTTFQRESVVAIWVFPDFEVCHGGIFLIVLIIRPDFIHLSPIERVY